MYFSPVPKLKWVGKCMMALPDVAVSGSGVCLCWMENRDRGKSGEPLHRLPPHPEGSAWFLWDPVWLLFTRHDHDHVWVSVFIEICSLYLWRPITGTLKKVGNKDEVFHFSYPYTNPYTKQSSHSPTFPPSHPEHLS